MAALPAVPFAAPAAQRRATGFALSRICYLIPGHIISALWKPEYEKMQQNAAKWLPRQKGFESIKL